MTHFRRAMYEVPPYLRTPYGSAFRRKYFELKAALQKENLLAAVRATLALREALSTIDIELAAAEARRDSGPAKSNRRRAGVADTQIIEKLAKNNYNVAKAATELGIGERAVRARLDATPLMRRLKRAMRTRKSSGVPTLRKTKV